MSDDPIQSQVYRSWLLALLDAYEGWRAAVPQLRLVRPPNLEIADHLGTRLGHWLAGRRCIALNAKLFTHAHWDDILAILKHEVAHLLADEVLGARDQTPHGPAFHTACGWLGIDPAATMALEATGSSASTPQIVERIHKLLALGQSPNHHEAELALAKAHELFLKYNLRELAAPRSGGYQFRVVGPPWKRVPAPLWQVVNLVADFYFVQYICRNYQDTSGQFGGGRFRVLELYGTAANLDLADYVFHFLWRQGQAEWELYQKANKLRNNRLRGSFLDGVYTGFRTSLERQRKHLADTEALVWVGDPALTTFFRARNPRVRFGRVHTTLDPASHADGIAIGTKLCLRHGVAAGRDTNSGPKGLLA